MPLSAFGLRLELALTFPQFRATMPSMGAIIDLWKSERGLMAMVLIIASFVLTMTGKVSAEVWVDYSKWIFVTYAAAKMVTSVAETRAGTSAAIAQSSTALSPASEAFLQKISKDPNPPV